MGVNDVGHSSVYRDGRRKSGELPKLLALGRRYRAGVRFDLRASVTSPSSPRECGRSLPGRSARSGSCLCRCDPKHPILRSLRMPQAWAISKMNMFLHNINDAQVALEDTLQAPQFVEDGYIKKFDRVIANPPFSQSYSRSTMEFPQRFRYGFAPEKGKKADLMFAQHMIASLNEKGVMATVMPHGVLFRGGAEKAIRKGIIRANIIEAIISLPPNLFYGTGIPACILVINKKKSKNLENKILFINADAEYGEGRAQNYLRPEDIEKITFVFGNKQEEPKYSRLIGLDEIEKNDYNLNIRRYVDNSPDPEIEDVYAHLVGGVPMREIALHEQDFCRYGLNSSVIFDVKDERYCLLKPAITNRAQIRKIVENHPAVAAENKKMDDALDRWWESARVAIEALPHHNQVAKFRRESINQFKKQLAVTSILDEFQQAGTFVNWWEAVRWDMKAIVATGWTPSLIPDDYIKSAFFTKELDELKALEAKASDLEAALSALFDEIEMDENGDEENGRTAKSFRSYLKEQITDLKDTETESAKKERETLEAALTTLEAKEKELKLAKKSAREKADDLEWKLEEKRRTFAEADAMALILQKFRDIAYNEMHRYLTSQKEKIVRLFEKLWDKYRDSLATITDESEGARKQLNDFIRRLKYL